MGIDKTVQAVFDKAIYLIDAQNEATGSTDTVDTKDYRVRTIGILNNLLDLVYPASDTYRAQDDGRRPALPDIRSFSDELELDARILRDVLPNGLAAKLISEENPTLAAYFQDCFTESLAMARIQMPAQFESIAEGSGGLEFCEFARW